MQSRTVLLVAGGILAVIGVTVLGFDAEVFEHDVDPAAEMSLDQSAKEDPTEFGTLSPEAQDVFLGALEVARESEDTHATYTVRGSSAKPPEFTYVSDASPAYVISYEGDLYVLSTLKSGPEIMTSATRVVSGAAATLLGFALLGVGRYLGSGSRVAKTVFCGVVVLVGMVWFNIGLPGYYGVTFRVGSRLAAFVGVSAVFWYALGIFDAGDAGSART